MCARDRRHNEQRRPVRGSANVRACVGGLLGGGLGIRLQPVGTDLDEIHEGGLIPLAQGSSGSGHQVGDGVDLGVHGAVSLGRVASCPQH